MGLFDSSQLERQIGTLYYERLLAGKDCGAVLEEAREKLTTMEPTPRDFVRDPVMLEFLGLPGTGRLLESKLEDAIPAPPAKAKSSKASWLKRA